MIFWVLLCFIAYLIYKIAIKPLQYWKNLNVPHVKPLPLFGNSGNFVFQKRSWAGWMQDLYNAYDDVRYIGVYQFNVPHLLIKDLELIKRIAIKDFDHFTGRQLLVTDDVEPIFSKNLLSLKGNKWKQTRATLSPTFTGNKMRAMFVLMKDCSEQFVKHIQKKFTPNGDETLEYEMRDLLGRFANDVIATTAFGIKCDSLEDENNDFISFSKKATTFGGMSTLLKVMGYIYAKPMMKLFNIKIFSDEVSNFFKNIVVSNIKDREEKNIVRPDMIHLLMEARKGKLKHEDNSKNNDDEDTGFATVEESDVGKNNKLEQLDLSDDDILAHTFVFFIAGFDGTSIIMAHMAYELAINQEIQRRLQEEITSTFEECDGNITYEKLMRMKYLDMVFCENLRKWSGPFVDRECSTTYTIPAEKPGEVPITLKPKDTILIPMYAFHRDPKNFPDPDKFDPERFNDENKKNIKPFSYIPFGIGPRNCIASRFGIMEVKIIMFYLLAHFNFVLTEKSQVPLQLSNTVFNMAAENGFWLGLQKRKKKTE